MEADLGSLKVRIWEMKEERARKSALRTQEEKKIIIMEKERLNFL